MDAIIVAKTLARTVRKRHHLCRFDVIEASNFMACGLFARWPDSPATIVRASYLLQLWDKASGIEPSWDRKVRYKLEELSLRRADLAYGPCTRMTHVLSRFSRREVDVIHPPVFPSIDIHEEDDRVWKQQLEDFPYVLFFGRICLVKGADVLAAAMRRLLRENDHLRLVMVGRFENDEFATKLRKVLDGQSGKLVHINRLEHKHLFPIIRRAECVALPSRADNFPNACVEAMAAQQIVIGTRGTGFEDLMEDGVNGFLVRSEAAEELELAIRRVLSLTSDEKASLKERALHRIQRTDPQEAVQQLIRYYQRAIDVKNQRQHRSFLSFPSGAKQGDAQF